MKITLFGMVLISCMSSYLLSMEPDLKQEKGHTFTSGFLVNKACCQEAQMTYQGIAYAHALLCYEPQSKVGLELINFATPYLHKNLTEQRSHELHAGLRRFLKNNLVPLLHKLCESGLPINVQNKDGNTLLHTVALEKNIEAMQVLLKCPGISVNIINKEGFAPADMAYLGDYDGYAHVAKILKIHNALVTKKGEVLRLDRLMCIGGTPEKAALTPQESFLKILKSGDALEVRACIQKQDIDLNAPCHGCVCPLHYAIDTENDKVVGQLIFAGADQLKRNKEGITPLLAALYKKKQTLIALLCNNPEALNQLFRIEVSRQEYFVPLLSLAYNDGANLSIIELLLKKGANPNKGGSMFAFAPINMALERNDIEMVKLLIRYKVDVNQTTHESESTPLHILATMKKPRPEIFELIMEHGGGLSKRNNGKMTPVSTACLMGNTWFVKCALMYALEHNFKDATTMIIPLNDDGHDYLEELYQGGRQLAQQIRAGAVDVVLKEDRYYLKAKN